MGVGSWMGVGGFGVCVVVEWVWFWVVCGWRDVCGWWVWMVMGCGWLWSLCGWRGMGGHRGVASWRCGWLREIMRKYILDDVSNATKNTFPVIWLASTYEIKNTITCSSHCIQNWASSSMSCFHSIFLECHTRHLHKMQSCLVFIHRECSLVYHMYNDIKLTIIIARFVVMWYSMPPIYIYIYCHHSFHEELQKFKYHYQWHMCQCHFPKLVCRGHVGQQIQYTDWQNTAWRIQLVLTTDCWIWSAHL